MDNEKETYDVINKAWKDTCRILLGEEIGELKDYEEWLLKGTPPAVIKPSTISNKPVALVCPFYCNNAKIIDYTEIDFKKKFEPLNINEIKDIDSIVNAIGERIYYTGGVVQGNSANVSESTQIMDSMNVYRSTMIVESKNVACSAEIRESENIFGVDNIGGCKYLIKSVGNGFNNRCFEVYSVVYSSDVYFSFYLQNCKNTMFSFNLLNKSYVIGNLQLSREKYLNIKQTILEQIKEDLRKNKTTPSLTDIVYESIKHRKEVPSMPAPEKPKEDFDEIEKGFKKTCEIVLGKNLGSLKDYGNYLTKHNMYKVKTIPSVVSGTEVYSSTHPIFSPIDGAIISSRECFEIGEKTKMDETDITNMETIKRNIWKIAYASPDIMVGENKNIIRTSRCGYGAINIFETVNAFGTKNSAYSYFPRDSEFVYGTSIALSASFCIHTHNSKKLKRCFELDSCENCTDLYFSHNCENVHDSMFCFNVKNLRNAIGNAPLPAKDYKKIKANILEQLANELEQNKDLKWDIYNIGCVKSK